MPCLRCLPGAMNILPGVPYLSDAHNHALGRCGSAYLDDAAAPGGRSRSLQEAGLGVPGGPCGAWQCDPAATVPHPATRGRGCSVPGGSVGGGPGVVFASGSVDRHRTLPASRALGHGQARFGSSRRDSTTDPRCPAPGRGALRHREKAPPDFVSAPDGGCSDRRNFVERRHRWGRGVLGLWSRRSAGRRGPAAGGGEKMRAGGRSRQKSSGRHQRRDANARSAQTKGAGRRARSLPSRDACGRSGDCGRATRHLPADRGAAAPGSAAVASTPLACDREGKTCFDSPRGLAGV